MAYDLEEQEKIDALKAWWERYGTLTTVLVFVVVAAFAGFRGWQWYEGHQADQAMGYFEALESASHQTGDESTTRIKAASQALRNDFSSSAYTDRAVLIAAAALEQRADLDGAKEQLEWLANSNKNNQLQSIAKLRLAGVLLSQGDYDAALKYLENPANRSYDALYADRKGDILAAQSKNDEAIKSWQQALESFGSDPAAQIVQLKIDALNGA